MSILLKQFFGYVWVGTFAFIIDAGLLLILVWLGVHYLLANTSSFVTANTANFFLGHYWVFRQRSRMLRILRSYFAIFTISIFALLINNAIMFVSVDWVRLPILTAKAVTTVIVLFWNFGARKCWVYT